MVTQAWKLHLYIKEDSPKDNHVPSIFRMMVKESYYDGKQYEFMTLTKPDAIKDFAFLTFITAATWDAIMKYGLTYHYEKLQVSATWDKDTTAPSELRISTTLVAHNLPQKETQMDIVIALTNKFGEGNIFGFNFGNQVEDK